METVSIDGSYGEGGGQILRTCVALAAITGRAVEITRIRAGRTKPGLQPQHLAAVRAAGMLCDAEIHGGEVGSGVLRFTPRAAVRPGDYTIEIGTAGATPLVAQTVLLPLALAGTSCVRVTGGTHVPHAPTADYLQQVYLPALVRVGITTRLQVPRAGFYPRGGGELILEIAHAPRLHPVTLPARGGLLALMATVLTAVLPGHVGARGVAAAEQGIRKLGFRGTVTALEKPSNGPGAAVLLAAHCEGGYAGLSALGERGKPMERVVEEAIADFARWWRTGAACDAHLADQLVLPLALCRGESRWTTPAITDHLRTVLWVAQQFLPIYYHLTEREDGVAEIVMTGAG